jgi:hypothetical protein
MDADHEDRLGSSSDALAEGRGGQGPLKRFRDQDLGENLADHLPGADPDVARRLAGADTGSLRAQEDDGDRSTGDRARHRADHPDRLPIYQGATSASGISRQDAGLGSAGASGGAGSPAGAPSMGAASGRSGSAPGVASTTGSGISTITGTGRTGGPSPGRDNQETEMAQPPLDRHR